MAPTVDEEENLVAFLTPISKKAAIEKSKTEAISFVLDQDDEDNSNAGEILDDDRIKKEAARASYEIEEKVSVKTMTDVQIKNAARSSSNKQRTDEETKIAAAPGAVSILVKRPASDDVHDDDAVDDVSKPDLARGSGRQAPQPGALRVAGLVAARPDDDEFDVHPSGEDGTEQPESAPALGDEEAPKIAAKLVDEGDELQRIKEALQLETKHAVQVVDLEAEDRLKRQRQQKKLLIYLAVAVTMTAAIVAAVVVTIRRNALTQAPTEAPTMAPTIAPTSRYSALLKVVEGSLGPLTSTDPTSPQIKALEWLANTDETITFPFDSHGEEEHEAEDYFFDRYVALVFAFSTGYETWHDNTGWLNQSTTVCHWNGLTCNDEGRVSVLDLAIQNLTGTLPTELGRMGSLDFVFLFQNSLTGTLPSELGELNDVDFFYLNDNQFTGSIPSELSGLLDADDLFLFGNRLTGTIPASFGDLVDLVNLYLHGNELSGTIPTTLAKLKRVQRLYLHSNHLTGTIPNDLGGIISLERLLLQDNELTGQIPSELASVLGLSMLSVQGNSLSGTVPDEICALRGEGLIEHLEVFESDCLDDLNCTCCSKCF